MAHSWDLLRALKSEYLLPSTFAIKRQCVRSVALLVDIEFAIALGELFP